MSENKIELSDSWMLGVLGIAFIILKLCHVINWSWWWVLSPFWLPFSAAIAIIAIFLLVSWIVAK